ncbi:MAG: anthranilate synthase component I family protein [Deltaproteobacteria bacterium]|nr:anthranilate synthase component I family protein [Deltaproteobacteria bacterium]
MDVFHKLYSQPYSFWLDSCGLRRYSFAGADPFVVIKAQNNKIEVIQGSTHRILTGNIFSILASALNEFKTTQQSIPFPFQGGAVGYFGYELKNHLEELPKKNAAQPILPDAVFGLYDTIFAYDHKTNKGYILASGFPEKNNKKKKQRAQERINQFHNLIKSTAPLFLPLHSSSALYRRIESNFTKDAYMNAIKHAQQYISSGDIYQVNLSQRLLINFNENPLLFYSNLRRINPAPFGAFINYGNFQVISNSPERLLKVKDDIAETSPIKGTRPRGRNLQRDRLLMKELKTSHKELAEHIMIVDLERSDLGKICEYGTIKVWPFQKICTYSTLHHMVSTIRGRIRDEAHPVDCLKSIFPGMDMSMAIRTAIVKDSCLYLNVGGGIVADSNPEEEYEETILKASAFFKARGIKNQSYMLIKG